MRFGNIFTATIVALGLNSLALGSSDSVLSDSSAMVTVVKSSKGAMIRVPVDNEGRELLSAAELRVVNDSVTKNDTSKLPQAWDRGLDVTNAPVRDSSTSSDSSTRGHFWGWNPWRWNYVGWYNPYYYTGYWPSYYYNGYTYSYGAPYYYNYYYPSYFDSPYWGYRYYYYPASW